MSARHWNSLIRLLLIAQDRGDRLTCILLAARLRGMVERGEVPA